ncbi:MAG: long-chain fatty acid--CoA ligase [Candidatus Harrisonbacteria bacterium]|nr:long-chain fatty acid--CoA ligase [Candidatus Harrisonbacteria bacterium]
MTLNQVFDRAVKEYPNNAALIFYGKRISYQDLQKQVDRLAAALQNAGVKKGDRVAIMLPNCPQNVISYFATLKAGGIVAQFNPQYTAEEVAAQLKDSGAKILIGLDLFSDRYSKLEGVNLDVLVLASIGEYLPFPLNWLYWFKERRDIPKKPENFIVSPFNKFLKSGDVRRLRKAHVYFPDVAVLQYTGGTTGVPKAAVLTHSNLVWNLMQVEEFFPGLQKEKEIMLAAPPLFHVFAMTVCQNLMVSLGGTIVLVPNPRDLGSVMKAIQEYRPTIFPGVPRLFAAVNAYLGKRKDVDMSSIKYCISGSAKLPVEVLERFEELTGALLVEGYGLSETSPVAICNPLDRNKRRKGSIGVLVPNTKAKIIDESGELALSGPQVMRGYWNKPEETEKVLKIIDGERWFYTGDVAKKDGDGYYYIVDRIKDMINVGGEKVFSLEVEEVLSKCPGVQEVAVVGIKNSRGSEEVRGFIVKKDSSINDEEMASQLKEFGRDKLAPYKIPVKFVFLAEIPKTAIGKTDKKKLRQT